MNRRPFYFRSLAVAATADSATTAAAANMSYRPHFRGGRPQIRRSYSDGPWAPADHPEFVSGDSHFSAVRDANRGFRPNYNAVPPPPQYVNGPHFYGPGPGPNFYGSGSGHHRPGPPVVHQVHGPRPYMNPRPVGPAFGNYQPFRPQLRQQQYRPRATKPPDYREWEYAKPGVPPHCERFSVLSYNILADYLGTDHWHNLYFHIPHYIMDWNWRKRNIIFELGLWSADILCFQEVDRFPDIEAELRPRGYNGIWKMRTGDPVDGCAIFWRVSRFKLMHEESIEFNKLGLRDNVAQICVFESVNAQNYKSGVSTLSTSPASSNRVVVCNIHVLFNPKRGDIKLGQIRALLDRAHAVSKLWDDAPIVICGDFNCTPKSPIYNFITEQKLDLSELARDRVSGQTSAEIRRPAMPAYPNFRTPAVDNSTQASAGDCEKIEHGYSPSDAQELAHLHVSTYAPSAGSYSKPGCSILDETSESCINKEHRSRRVNDFPSNDAADSSAIKNMSTTCTTQDVLNRSVSSTQGDAEFPILPDRGTDEISVSESSNDKFHSEATEGRENVESNSQTLSESPDNQINDLRMPDNHSPSKTSEPLGTYDSGASQLEGPSGKLLPNSPDAALSEHVSAAHENNSEPSVASASCEATSVDIKLDEKLEALSLDEVVDGAADEPAEDHDSFFSELLYSGQSPIPTDPGSSSSIQQLHSHGNEILDENLKHESVFRGNFSYNTSAWTPAEIQTATGSADCNVVEHPLKLISAYAEVENSSGLRDSSGEPFVTSYHRCFLGTVDYIWHSEGLQTVKVLAPIPKDVMQQTRGFPTKKWGSDHIALVSEFAFAKETTSQNSNQ
ncbi:hypothetical protein ACS0TY_012297 [Phlomoides rotata]